MGAHWLIALLALPGACQEPPGYQQKLERARHRIAQLERVVERLRSELDGLRPPFAALWHARGVAARQATTCGTPAMRAVLDDLRGRRPGTHGEVWFPFEGGGFGNELNKYLAGCALAIALNRTARIVVGGAKTIGLFEPRLGDWRSDSAPSGENATTLDYRAAVACAPSSATARNAAAASPYPVPTARRGGRRQVRPPIPYRSAPLPPDGPMPPRRLG